MICSCPVGHRLMGPKIKQQLHLILGPIPKEPGADTCLPTNQSKLLLFKRPSRDVQKMRLIHDQSTSQQNRAQFRPSQPRPIIFLSAQNARAAHVASAAGASYVRKKLCVFVPRTTEEASKPLLNSVLCVNPDRLVGILKAKLHFSETFLGSLTAAAGKANYATAFHVKIQA